MWLGHVCVWTNNNVYIFTQSMYDFEESEHVSRDNGVLNIPMKVHNNNIHL